MSSGPKEVEKEVEKKEAAPKEPPVPDAPEIKPTAFIAPAIMLGLR